MPAYLQITENLKVPYLEDEINPNVLRVGWSVHSLSLQLGEDPLSYGFGATGKKSTKCQFQDYGKPFVVNDIIGCYLVRKQKCEPHVFFGYYFFFNFYMLPGYGFQ